jgi:hypothetical protein
MRVSRIYIPRNVTEFVEAVSEGTTILGVGPGPGISVLAGPADSSLDDEIHFQTTLEGDDAPSGMGYVGCYESQSSGFQYLWVSAPHRWLRGDFISIPEDGG